MQATGQLFTYFPPTPVSADMFEKNTAKPATTMGYVT